MKFTFLGTGTSLGVPVIACPCKVCQSTDIKDNRLRSAGMIQTGNTTIVIDTGPDFRQQMLREKTKSLNAVVFTHAHKDHIAGLDDVRAFNFLMKKEMNIFADAHTIKELKREFMYVFAEEKYPGIPEIMLNEISTEAFQIGDISLQPIPVMHHKLPILGFRMGNFAYITDANYIPDTSMKLLEGVETLVLNALRIEPHISHFNLEQAIEMVKLLQPKSTYFTHISHLLGKHAEINKILPKNIQLAYDGLKIDVS